MLSEHDEVMLVEIRDRWDDIVFTGRFDQDCLRLLQDRTVGILMRPLLNTLRGLVRLLLLHFVVFENKTASLIDRFLV
jgi:hypothetical protein